MILTCPKCNTQYSLNPKSIGLKGKRVKCIKCDNIWHQELPPDVFEELRNYLEEVKEQENAKIARHLKEDGGNGKVNINNTNKKSKNSPAVGANMPVIFGRVPLSYKIGLLLSLLMVVAGFLINFTDLIVKNNAYEDIVISGTEANIYIKDNKYIIDLTGAITNLSDEFKVAMPNINASVLSEGGNLLAESTIEPLIKTIPQSEEIFFKASLSGITGNAKILILDIGTDFERSLR